MDIAITPNFEKPLSDRARFHITKFVFNVLIRRDIRVLYLLYHFEEMDPEVIWSDNRIDKITGSSSTRDDSRHSLT